MQAVSHGVKIVELDVSLSFDHNWLHQVWLTSDNHLVVVHGGYSGEINHGDTEPSDEVQNEYIFENTLEENIKLESAFTLPTLRQVIEATNKNVFIFIEMKVPWDLAIKEQYRWKVAAKETFKLLMEFDMKEHCLVQSFDSQILEEFEQICSSELYKVRTVYLHNFYNYIPLPPTEVILSQGDGISCSLLHVNKELVDACRLHGKILSVWIDSDVSVENTSVHQHLLD